MNLKIANSIDGVSYKLLMLEENFEADVLMELIQKLVRIKDSSSCSRKTRCYLEYCIEELSNVTCVGELRNCSYVELLERAANPEWN